LEGEEHKTVKTEILRAIASQAWSLVTAALSALVAAQSDKPWLRRAAFSAAILFAVLFLLLAISDSVTIYRNHVAAQELANLRREGWKRYTEWWTHCQESENAANIYKHAETTRLQIISLLTEKVSETEAEYFNTPKAAEPFPTTTVVQCPQGVLVNQFAHRLERLGEIIQRIKQRGGSPRTSA
jgi:hypothetical protein